MFQIKICGITRAADVWAAGQAGVDAIGLNFCRQSPRYLDAGQARQLADAVPAPMLKVGVFVNATAAQMGQLAEAVGLDALQLHGDEPPEMLADLPALAVIRAFRCPVDEGQAIVEYLERCAERNVRPAMVLIDALQPGQYGGTGQTADWNQVCRIRRTIPGPLALAGGLTAQNVQQAIWRVRPDAVDTASGVETRPGQKDHRRIAEFVRQARAAFATPAAQHDPSDTAHEP